jgi:hypothetical protein
MILPPPITASRPPGIDQSVVLLVEGTEVSVAGDDARVLVSALLRSASEAAHHLAGRICRARILGAGSGSVDLEPSLVGELVEAIDLAAEATPGLGGLRAAALVPA